MVRTAYVTPFAAISLERVRALVERDCDLLVIVFDVDVTVDDHGGAESGDPIPR